MCACVGMCVCACVRVCVCVCVCVCVSYVYINIHTQYVHITSINTHTHTPDLNLPKALRPPPGEIFQKMWSLIKLHQKLTIALPFEKLISYSRQKFSKVRSLHKLLCRLTIVLPFEKLHERVWARLVAPEEILKSEVTTKVAT